jgi:hypothetical protein
MSLSGAFCAIGRNLGVVVALLSLYGLSGRTFNP